MNTFPEETVECTDDKIIEYLKKNDRLAVKLINKFEAFIDNLEALKDDAWLEHAIKGFKKPDVEVRIEKQVRTSTTKKMLNDAFKKMGDGESITPPNKSKIEAVVREKVEERHREIQAAKDLKVTKARAALSPPS